MAERLAYRVPEAAAVLGISPRAAWRLVQQGQLQVVRSGKIVLVPRTAIEEFLKPKPATDEPLPEWLQPMVVGGKRRRRR